MPRKPALLFALTLVTAAVGAAVYAAAVAPMPEGTAPPPGPLPSAEGAAPAAEGVRSRRPLDGRGEPAIEAALKRLDLIRPSRPKYAPDFTLPTPGGGRVRLSEQRGKVVLVNFWATWCPPCLEEMPAMERLWRRHKDAGFVLLAVSLDADPRKVPPFVSARKFTFPVAVDPKMTVAETYGVRALPSSFVIDRDGTIAGVALGPRAWDDAAAHGLLQAMLR